MERQSPIATPQEVAAYRRTTVGALWTDVDAWLDEQTVKAGA